MCGLIISSRNLAKGYSAVRDANTFYIGKTKRHLATRVREHSQSSSAIHEHLTNCAMCKSNYSVNSFRVVDVGNSDLAISIKEAMHIKLK